MRQIARSVDASIVTGISRVNLKDVRRVIAGVEPARQPGINIFAPFSAAFLDKAAATRERTLDAAVAAIRYAKQHLDYVEFSAQDATRSDREFLLTAFSVAIEAGASVLCVAETRRHSTAGRVRRALSLPACERGARRGRHMERTLP